MPAAPIPPTEVRRLVAVQKLRMMGTPAEERFDKITRLAKRMFNVPIAVIDIIGEKRVWLKSVQGLDGFDAPRDVSYCQFTILSSDVCYIPDTQQDARLVENPHAHAGADSVRFYAGYALKFDGENVGVLCVADYVPRTMSDDDVASLRDLADLAEHELTVAKLTENQTRLAAENLELEAKAHVDDLTRIWNRGAIHEILRREIEQATTSGKPCAVLALDIDHFKQINDRYGHPAGDEVLRQVSARLRAFVRPTDAVGRSGGEEFLIVLPACGIEGAMVAGERVRKALSAKPMTVLGATLNVTVSVGVAASEKAATCDAMLAAADEALYCAKRGGRDRVA